MIRLICRIHVQKSVAWQNLFTAHLEAREAAGLIVEDHWQDCSDSNAALIALAVRAIARVQKVLYAPESARVVGAAQWSVVQANEDA